MGFFLTIQQIFAQLLNRRPVLLLLAVNFILVPSLALGLLVFPLFRKLSRLGKSLDFIVKSGLSV
jgi:BASS family bile acid:Na+ symporter